MVAVVVGVAVGVVVAVAVGVAVVVVVAVVVAVVVGVVVVVGVGVSDLPDALAIAVQGLDYRLTERPMPAALEVDWFVARHPCNDEPYLAGIGTIRAVGEDAELGRRK